MFVLPLWGMMLMGLPCLPCSGMDLRTLAWPRQGHWFSCWRKFQASALNPSLSKHNSYCFRKILETFRLQLMVQSENNIATLYIQESHWERFNKLVDYYFPVESASFILQGSEINSTILSKHQSYQIGSWLVEDGLPGYMELLYRASQDGWKASYFHSKYDNKGATIIVICSSGGFIFGGFADK